METTIKNLKIGQTFVLLSPTESIFERITYLRGPFDKSIKQYVIYKFTNLVEKEFFPGDVSVLRLSSLSFRFLL